LCEKPWLEIADFWPGIGARKISLLKPPASGKSRQSTKGPSSFRQAEVSFTIQYRADHAFCRNGA